MLSQIKSHFNSIGVHSDIKYIDPTYMLRAVRANASDAILCTVLGQNAVRHHFSSLKKSCIFSRLTICHPVNLAGPRCLCRFQWHHNWGVQHAQCVLTNIGSHQVHKIRRSKQPDVASVPDLNRATGLPLINC